MMKLYVTSFFAMFTFSLLAQTEAPLNPDYKKYMERKSLGLVDRFTSTGDALGEIPEITLPHFNTFEPVTVGKGNKNLPATYDLRPLNLVTPVKNQNPYNTCWTFASAGAIESHWLKIGFGEYDLAERNVATCNGFEWGWNNGGNRKLASAYYTRLGGPFLESEEPYASLAVDTNCHTGLVPVAYESEARFLPNNMDSIKQALLDFGAIYTNYYHDNTYYNSADKTYYCPDALGTNHAVLIVGWDDNYVTDAPNNGAWIIKNSWGPTWGEAGFFYLSYYDANVNSGAAYYVSRVDYNPLANLYLYDELGSISSTGYTAEVAYGLTKYVATSNQTITKVGTYVNTQGSTIFIEVYDNMVGNSLTGLLGTVTDQICDYPGYYMFDLPTGININNGNDFYIKVKYNTPGYNFPIPYEKFSSGYADPTIEAGVCWISSSGATWTAVGNDVVGKERDLCIRAYAVPQTSSTGSDLLLNNKIQLYPNPFTDNASVIISGKASETFQVTICDITGKVILEQSIVSNEKISIGQSIAPGVYVLNIKGNNNEYKNSVKLVKIE